MHTAFASGKTPALAERNATIVAGMAQGRPASDLAAQSGLHSKSVLKIGTKLDRSPKGKPATKPRHLAPLPVSTMFDQASAAVLAILGAKPGRCRWPIGAGERFRFCGARATAGHKAGVETYCRACAALAFQPRARAVRPRAPEQV